jgi:SAM-dependent methyltransferase
MRVLDLACGRGRHAIAAATRGATVVAVDVDAEKIAAARRAAARLSIEWVAADLTRYELPDARFDVVMAFNYLDRSRMEDFRRAVRPGGYLMCETFLEQQRDHGWGPTSPDHLLKRGELIQLAAPFEIVLAREALEFIGGRPMEVASVLARRAPE